MSSWRDRAVKIQSDWKERAKSRQPDISNLESAIRGATQGATLGFSDEVSGALEGAYDFAKENITGDGISYNDAYTKARDEARDNNKLAQAANPYTYGASEIGGSVASNFIPGLNVAKGATLAARVGKAALGGAASGLGMNEDSSLGGMIKDTAIGGALGAGFQGIGEKYLGPATSKVGDWIKDSGPTKALGKIIAGVTPENTERYLARKTQVNAAKELDELGDSFNNEIMDKFKNKLSTLDDEAWKVLETDPNISKDEILMLGENHIQQLLAGKKGNLSRVGGTGADSDKINAIRGQLKEIEEAYGDNLSQSDLKSIVKNIQDLGWSLGGEPKTSHQGSALRELSGLYNNALKTINPTYAKKMLPVAAATDNLSSLERQFVNKRAPEQIDKFIKAAKKFDRPTVNREALDAVKKMDKFTGDNFEDQIRDRLAFDAFERGDTNGSRKVLTGVALGAIGGGFGGSAIGAATGMAMDKYAGKAFKQILNGQLAAGEGMKKVAPYLGKFAPALEAATARGNQAVAATHYILSQTNPEYRNLVKKLEEEDRQ